LGTPILGASCYLPYLRRRIGRAFQHRRDRAISYSSLLGYGARIWLGSLSGVVLSRIDQLLMVPLSNAGRLVLYAVAVTVCEAPVMLSSAMRNVVFSADSADSAGSGVNASSVADHRLQQTARIASMLTLAVAVSVVT